MDKDKLEEKHNCDNVNCNHNNTKGLCCMFNPANCKYRQLQKENAELDCQKNRNKFCYSCVNATERCFRNEIGCPCENYKSYKDENAELKSACDETQELLDKQIEATYKVDKENTELRDNYEQYKAVAEPEIKSLKEENAELKKMYHETDEDNNKLRENIPLLAEAKELIKRFIETSNPIYFEEDRQKVKTDAEQFLKEIKEMFNLNELCVIAYENAAKREAKDGRVSTETMQMLKHTATEVVEATEAYIDYGYINKTQAKRVFASELADIVCCVLIIAGKENIDMEDALTACMEKNYKRAIGQGDK